LSLCSSAWKTFEEEERRDYNVEEKKTFNSCYEVIRDYSEYSTIQGLIYIFFKHQSLYGKIFWIITILCMLALGVYFINILSAKYP
jgi:hypothetical protein